MVRIGIFAVVLSAAALTASLALGQPVDVPALQKANDAFKPSAASIQLAEFDKLEWTGTVGRNQTHRLFGDPAKEGPYALLMKWYPGAHSKPHLHPTRRYITVISGTWWVSSSAVYDESKMYPVAAGSVVVHEPEHVHWDGAKGEPVILEIVGVGPAPTIAVDEQGKPLPPAPR
jgi:quercetin dioxygenase-like cupin family protein